MDSLHKRINRDNMVTLYQYFFLIINYQMPNIDYAELFTLLFILLGFTFYLSSYPDFAVIHSQGLLFYLNVIRISTIGQCFLHLDLVSYQDRLRNFK